MKKIIIITLLVFISCYLFSENSFPDIRMILLLNRMDLNQEFDFSFLLNYTKDDLTVLLNVSFAKHGRPFKSRRLRDIFQNTTWYNINPYYKDSMLTATDKINAAKIYAILSLSPDNETQFYKIKRVKQFLSDGYPTRGIRISINNEKEYFIIDGKLNKPDSIWYNDTDNEITSFNNKISISEYGVGGWFIYNDTFYFFIEEVVKVFENTAYKTRIYLYCTLDYNKKTISDLNLLAASTEEF